MPTTRLQIYNGALLLCGERSLDSLSEAREPRRLLDVVWQGGGVRYCLEQAQWKFAMRAAQFTYDPGITPEFGYTFCAAKPTDWVATSGVCTDPAMRVPLLDYKDERGYWFTNFEDIYVRYISDHADYGGNLSLWTQTFTEYVMAYFAKRICRKLPGGGEKIDDIEREERETLKVAKNKDAMADPPKVPPLSSWPSARLGRSRYGGPMGDGGNAGSLTG